MKYIKMLFAFLLPILGKAAVQTAADVLTEVAYPDRRRMTRSEAKAAHPSNGENRVRPESYSGHNRVGENPFLTSTHEGAGYHDVLMMAFDISGPNVEVVKQFLYNYLPVTGAQIFQGEKIYLDACWIADDTAGDSDCDSAVFVPKGDQEAARGVLRERGFTN